MRVLRGCDGSELDARQSLRVGQRHASLHVVVRGKRDVRTRLLVELSIEVAAF